MRLYDLLLVPYPYPGVLATLLSLPGPFPAYLLWPTLDPKVQHLLLQITQTSYIFLMYAFNQPPEYFDA